jgi:arylsulfatase A-like enzyme
MNTITLLFDSLNLAYLGPYRDPLGPYAHIDTRNFDRLAARACTFTNHWITSTPCMPARRDLCTGRAEFPWRDWGPLDGCDCSLFAQLHPTSVHTQLFSDHHHLWERGGGNYHVDFKGFEFVRGQECDTWKNHPVPGTPYDRGVLAERDRSLKYGHGQQYVNNRGGAMQPGHYPGLVTMQAATDWLDQQRGQTDSFCLVIDEFDPHEPFDCPEPYRSMYLNDRSEVNHGYTYWPTYGPADRYASTELAYIRAQYCGLLTMMDHALGRLLDVMDRHNLWADTMLVVTSDHGHYLGEYGHLGKKTAPLYPFYANTPLFIHHPASRFAGLRCDALNNLLDVSATLFEAHGINPQQEIHGRSLLPVLTGEQASVRADLLYGEFGGALYYTDGEHLLCQPSRAGYPLHRYGLNFDHAWNRGEDLYSGAEAGRFLPWTQSPVLRSPLMSRDCSHEPPLLINLRDDWWATHNLHATEQGKVAQIQARMSQAMHELEMPTEHWARLGLPPHLG